MDTWSTPLPPRSEGIEWWEDDDPPRSWHRLARGAALAVVVAGAATALAMGLYIAGKFVIGQLVGYFGSGLS
jgi:hypothetical protein